MYPVLGPLGFRGLGFGVSSSGLGCRVSGLASLMIRFEMRARTSWAECIQRRIQPPPNPEKKGLFTVIY